MNELRRSNRAKYKIKRVLLEKDDAISFRGLFENILKTTCSCRAERCNNHHGYKHNNHYFNEEKND